MRPRGHYPHDGNSIPPNCQRGKQNHAMRTAHTAAPPKVGFVITNPLTGKPMKQTPDGLSLDDKVFPTKEELELFVQQHWQNAVFCAEVKA